MAPASASAKPAVAACLLTILAFAAAVSSAAAVNTCSDKIRCLQWGVHSKACPGEGGRGVVCCCCPIWYGDSCCPLRFCTALAPSPLTSRRFGPE
ncbi:hypothetical protein SEVIR_1G222500v4 [Setaria viridis]|uniref:Uncharacterized protein n=1 Tax=Setaria viridis TaxID=4556 RepID=A0A4U6WBI6_SETVI|nr:hypothetical protein SEVIR_1G222500v2 [Setaria viridis]